MQEASLRSSVACFLSELELLHWLHNKQLVREAGVEHENCFLELIASHADMSKSIQEIDILDLFHTHRVGGCKTISCRMASVSKAYCTVVVLISLVAAGSYQPKGDLRQRMSGTTSITFSRIRPTDAYQGRVLSTQINRCA